MYKCVLMLQITRHTSELLKLRFGFELSENLYFTNAQSEDTYVEVSRLDGSYRLILYVAENDKPRSIAVNPIKR